MPELEIFHGRIVDLRRYVNMHSRHLHPFVPTDRCELWLTAPDGAERRFSVDTRDMPARRGHGVSLVTMAAPRPRVLALANRTTSEVVNYARREPQGLLRAGDLVWLAVGFVGMTAWLRSAGLLLFVPGAVVVLAGVVAMRWVARRRLARRVDRAIELAIRWKVKGDVVLRR